MSSIIHTAFTQARADLRSVFFSSSLLGFILGPGFIIGLGYYLSDHVRENVPISMGSFILVSSIGAFATMITIQINSEMYSERLDGTLLRVRTLPHGALSWALGKTLSNLILQGLVQAVIFLGIFLLTPPTSINAVQWAIVLPLALLAIFASAPIGFILGSLVRGVYSQLLLYVAAIAAVATSGAFFPITLLPTWMQYIHMALPFYWAGHLSRWALLGSNASAFDITASPQPVLAMFLLLAWMTAGFALATWSINRSFRKLSLSSLASMQSAMRSQLGV